MKLFVETTLETLFVVLLDEKYQIIDFFQKIETKKADLLPGVIKNLFLSNQKLSQDLTSIYVTVGPGSFMGNRVGLVFTQTLAKVLKIPFYYANTFVFIAQGIENQYFIDAKSNQSYEGYWTKDQTKIKLVDFQPNSKVDYESFKNDPWKTLQHFQFADQEWIEPTYIKEPQIGGA